MKWIAVTLLVIGLCTGCESELNGTTPDEEASTVVDSTGNEPVSDGRMVYEDNCSACHKIDRDTIVGRKFGGAWGLPVKQEDGSTLTFDRAFLRESLSEPSKHITQGYTNLMPPYMLEENLMLALEEFLKSLAER